MSIAQDKAAAREAAFARRAAATGGLADHLLDVLRGHAGAVVSGYLPIRTEIDPRPAMAEMCRHGDVCVPVIAGQGQPLTFARWTPDTRLRPGRFGAAVPADPEWLVPQVLIVPLLAFDASGHRLGYGGGFYDRTLLELRRVQPTTAIGFAYAEQQVDAVPLEPTDQPLDLIVTQHGVVTPAG